MADDGGRIDIDALKRAVSIRGVVEAWVPGIKWRRQGRELVALSPLKVERTPSFTIDPRTEQFYCFATAQGGDAIRFVELVDGCDFREAASRIARRMMGSVPRDGGDDAARAARSRERAAALAAADAADAADDAARRAAALDIWRRTFPGGGTPVEAYLAARGVDLDAIHRVHGIRVPASLRFAPALPYRDQDTGRTTHVGPAMVGMMCDAGGRFAGVHRTYLAADGAAKASLGSAKLTLGSVMGSHGWLADGAGARRVVLVGEGYETTLTVVAALARLGIAAMAMSALTLGNLAGAGLGRGRAHPTLAGRRLPSLVPDQDRPGLVLPPAAVAAIKAGGRLVLLEDADGRDPLNARALMMRAGAKFRACGLGVCVASPRMGCDFNDMIGAQV